MAFQVFGLGKGKALKKILHHSFLQDGHLGSIYCLVHLFLHQALTRDHVVCASCNSLRELHIESAPNFKHRGNC